MSTPQVALSQGTAREPRRWAWVQARPVWASLTIMVMWLAVLLDGVYGGDIVSNGGGAAGGGTAIPSAVVIAFFACIATVSIARHGFGSDTGSRPSGEGK
jgi:hypothetical protein